MNRRAGDIGTQRPDRVRHAPPPPGWAVSCGFRAGRATPFDGRACPVAPAGNAVRVPTVGKPLILVAGRTATGCAAPGVAFPLHCPARRRRYNGQALPRRIAGADLKRGRRQEAPTHPPRHVCYIGKDSYHERATDSACDGVRVWSDGRLCGGVGRDCDPAATPAGAAAPAASGQRDHVYVFLVNGLDPFFFCQFNKMPDYVRSLGYDHVSIGQMNGERQVPGRHPAHSRGRPVRSHRAARLQLRGQHGLRHEPHPEGRRLLRGHAHLPGRVLDLQQRVVAPRKR